MARYRRQRDNPGVFDNPRFLGADLRGSAEGVGGIVLTAIVNDKLLSPLTRRFVAGFKHANNTVGQLIDSGTTFLAAMGVGMVGSRFLGAATGRRMLEGGQMYAAAKGVTAFVPNVSVSAQYPDFFPSLGLFAQPAVGGMQQGAQAALASGAGSGAMLSAANQPASVF